MCDLMRCPYKNDDSMLCDWCPNRDPSEFDYGDYDEFNKFDDFEDYDD